MTPYRFTRLLVIFSILCKVIFLIYLSSAGIDGKSGIGGGTRLSVFGFDLPWDLSEEYPELNLTEGSVVVNLPFFLFFLPNFGEFSSSWNKWVKKKSSLNLGGGSRALLIILFVRNRTS